MTETQLVAWFVAHPFVRNLIIAALAGTSSMAMVDWSNFKEFKITEPHASFDFRVAAFNYFQGMAIGVGPVIVSKLYFILGG